MVATRSAQLQNTRAPTELQVEKTRYEDIQRLLNEAKGTQDPFVAMENYRPEFSSPLTGDSLNPAYVMSAQPSNIAELNQRLGAINLDKRGLEAYRERALATPGTSAWEQMQRARLQTEQASGRDLAASQQAQALGQARSQLAMRGGLSSGAGERLAMQGAKDRLLANQALARQGQMGRQDIAIQAEQQRLGALQNLPGMELQALEPEFKKTSMWGNMADTEAQRRQQVEAQNINTKLAALDAKNRYGTDVYKTNMQAWAAGRQAQAIEDQGKK